MARVIAKISAPVGAPAHIPKPPNRDTDLEVVTGLFDRIPVAKGGNTEVGIDWVESRDRLIADLTAQIVRFQTVNKLPVCDGVLDPAGASPRLMNQLAADPCIVAAVWRAPDAENSPCSPYEVAEVSSLPGTRPLRPDIRNVSYVRKSVRVEGSSIVWFGVVIPSNCSRQGSVPHIFFTPKPDQGGYPDSAYGKGGIQLGGLWKSYTWAISCKTGGKSLRPL
jgi:hypothetical protein